MKLFCRMMFAALVFTAVSTTASAQMTEQSRAAPIRPFATLSIGPGGSNSQREGSGAYPVAELALGARKRLTGRFGIAASAHVGKTINQVLGGEDTYCRTLVKDGRDQCVEHVPMLDWFGAAVGAEAYVGRSILSLSTGPASFGTMDYERIASLAAQPTRSVGLRTQFEAILPIYGSAGLSLSAAHRSVPKILGNRMHVTSFGLGITIR